MQIRDEIWECIQKGLMFFLYGIVGLIGKFSMDIIKKKTITWIQAFADMGVALFVGWLATVICLKLDPAKAPFIIPLSTYMASRIATMLMNWSETKKYLLELINKL